MLNNLLLFQILTRKTSKTDLLVLQHTQYTVFGELEFEDFNFFPLAIVYYKLLEYKRKFRYLWCF